VLSLGPPSLGAGVLQGRPQALDKLAAQAAPALRVGQLVRSRRWRPAPGAFRGRARGGPAHPAELPAQGAPRAAGWRSPRYYRRPARWAGDFYDVIPLPDGQVASSSATSRTRACRPLVSWRPPAACCAPRAALVDPAVVLERVNEHLCPDMPAKMFVTCLYGVLQPRRALPFRQRRPRPAVRQDRRRVGRAARRGDAARTDDGDGLRGEGDRPRAGRLPAAALRRRRGGPRPCGRCSGSRGSRRRSRTTRVVPSSSSSCWPTCAHTSSRREQEDDITMLTLARAASTAAGEDPAPPRQLVEFDVPAWRATNDSPWHASPRSWLPWV
jgi:hypothetical protein